MRMLLLGIALLAACTGVQAQAQDVQDIKSRINQYFTATEDKDWETVVDFLYPPLFEQVSKAEMVQMFADMSGNGMEVDMSGYRIKRISAPFAFESERYAPVSYMGTMTIQFTSDSYKTPEMVGMIKGNLEGTHGTNAVSYDGATNTFTVLVDKVMYAIADEGTKNWYFIENDAQNPMTQKLIPAEVRAHFADQ
ncbi:MAG: hypothetical protein RIC19_17635 [Phaeodactylibacter sp.]|uniref:hypothetical protein n=1 Tax=Phaeodactylibacter sp. TaxID=1940289 RepID=UPI0032EEF060